MLLRNHERWKWAWNVKRAAADEAAPMAVLGTNPCHIPSYAKADARSNIEKWLLASVLVEMRRVELSKRVVRVVWLPLRLASQALCV